MAVDRENIIEMIDEDGGVFEFEYLLTFEVEDDYFLAFTPIEPMEEFDLGDVLIMRIGEDDDGEEVYLPIESQEELDALWEIFQELYEEEAVEDEMIE